MRIQTHITLCLGISLIISQGCHRKGPYETGETVSLLTVYYPLEIENWWLTRRIYWENGDTIAIDTMKLEIAGKDTVLGDKVCYLGIQHPGEDTSWFVILDDERRIYSDVPTETSSYTLALKLPFDIGNSWGFFHSSGVDSVFAKITSRTAVITVPAGTFTTCLQIQIQSESGVVWFTWWLAPGVGIVRSYNARHDSGWDFELLDYYVAEEDLYVP